MSGRHHPWCVLALMLIVTSAGGCASAVAAGTSTLLSGSDLIAVTDDMAMQIAGDPEVRAAIGRDGPLRVVVRPVENRMRGEILPQGQADAFTARVRVLLSRLSPDDFVWVMNRDAWQRLRQAELDLSPDPLATDPLTGRPVDVGLSPDVVLPRYALTATFHSLAEEDARRREAFYLCAFRLTDLDDRTLLWSGAYELRKTARKQFLD